MSNETIVDYEEVPINFCEVNLVISTLASYRDRLSDQGATNIVLQLGQHNGVPYAWLDYQRPETPVETERRLAVSGTQAELRRKRDLAEYERLSKCSKSKFPFA
jgi:hypothetical protein